ncbi:MAG: hypothetical protein H6622_01155 [Halobacteriovoraceae bacterium]|nr:hypothetical protein [Halobacteriovoraceae bacterium]
MGNDHKPAFLYLLPKSDGGKGKSVKIELVSIDNLGVSFDVLETSKFTEQKYIKELLPTTSEKPGRVVLEIQPTKTDNLNGLEILSSLHKKIKVNFCEENDPLLKSYKTDMQIIFSNEIGEFKYDLIGAFPLGFSFQNVGEGSNHNVSLVIHYDFIENSKRPS